MSGDGNKRRSPNTPIPSIKKSKLKPKTKRAIGQKGTHKSRKRRNEHLKKSLETEQEWRDRLINELAPRLAYPHHLISPTNAEPTHHLFEAFTHRTFAHEQRQARSSSAIDDNQRLEFLGDSILGYICTIHIFERSPGLSEGELSALRASLINRDTLKEIALQLGLESYLRLGRGEPKMGEAARAARLADLTEAVIGAIYLDLGIEHTSTWVWAQLEPRWRLLCTKSSQNSHERLERDDPKTALQHWAHQKYKVTPRYETTALETENAVKYRSIVTLDDELIGQGEGITKKLAEKSAATQALNKKHLL